MTPTRPRRTRAVVQFDHTAVRETSLLDSEVVTTLDGGCEVWVVETRTLVDLDVMEKGTLSTLNVLELNGTEAVKSVDLSGRKLGPLSATIIAVCAKKNTVLEALK